MSVPTGLSFDGEPGASYQPQWGQWTRHVAAVALLIGGVYVLTLVGPILQILIVALLIAFAMIRPVRVLAERTPLSYGAAVGISYAVLLLVLIVAIAVLIPILLNQANALWEIARDAYESGLDALERYQPEHGIAEILGLQVDLNPVIEPVRRFIIAPVEMSPEAALLEMAVQKPPAQPESSIAADFRQLLEGAVQVANLAAQVLASALAGVTGFVTTLIVAILVSFLVVIDLPNVQTAISQWMPPVYHREYAILIHRINHVWSGFFRGQLVLCLIIAILTWVQLTLMGIANAGLLAILVGIISLIPTIGGFVALAPLAIVPLVQGSMVLTDLPNSIVAFAVVGVNLIISQVIWNVIAPKVLGDALNLPAVVIILGVFIGAAVGGVLGAFLVSPIIGTLRILVAYLLRKIGQQDPFPGVAAPFVVGEDWLCRIASRSSRRPDPSMVPVVEPVTE